jgi:hypothetical protein
MAMASPTPIQTFVDGHDMLWSRGVGRLLGPAASEFPLTTVKHATATVPNRTTRAVGEGLDGSSCEPTRNIRARSAKPLFRI